MMRTRQKNKPALYPRWLRKQNSPATLAKARDGWTCVDCGAKNRSLAENAEGQLCMIYVHAAHVHPLDPDPIEPIEGQRLRARCPHCHGIYDAYWRRRAEPVEHQRRLHGILRNRFFEQRFLQVV
jgi:hypothetical protein